MKLTLRIISLLFVFVIFTASSAMALTLAKKNSSPAVAGNLPIAPKPQVQVSECTPGTDTDGDCVADADDNCPYTPNEDQADTNWDHVGDVCQNDWDNDGAVNDIDNCYAIPNQGQEDLDGDDIGDACDRDRDGDGYTNDFESTIGTNPDNWDSDSDNVSDYYDCAKLDDTKAIAPDCDMVTVIDDIPDGGNGPTPDIIDEPGRDDDGDGIPNVNDNCPVIYNPGQQDGDGDGIGDLCDMLPGRRSEFLFIKGGGGSDGGGCSLTATASGGSLAIELLIALPALALALLRGRKKKS